MQPSSHPARDLSICLGACPPCHTQLITCICSASHSDLTLPHLRHLPLKLGHLFLFSTRAGTIALLQPSRLPSTLQADPNTRFPRKTRRCLQHGLAPHLDCRVPRPPSRFSSQPGLHPPTCPSLHWRDSLAHGFLCCTDSSDRSLSQLRYMAPAAPQHPEASLGLTTSSCHLTWSPTPVSALQTCLHEMKRPNQNTNKAGGVGMRADNPEALLQLDARSCQSCGRPAHRGRWIPPVPSGSTLAPAP